MTTACRFPFENWLMHHAETDQYCVVTGEAFAMQGFRRKMQVEPFTFRRLSKHRTEENADKAAKDAQFVLRYQKEKNVVRRKLCAQN